MLFRRVLASMILSALLSACAAAPPEPPPGTVRIGPDIYLTLPRPGDLGREVQAAQLITAHYGDKTFVFEGHLNATADRFLLVGLDPMGRKAMTITWTDAGIDTQVAPWLPQGLRPDNMLADIVLLYWPEDTVRAALSPASATLTSSAHSRSVLSKGQEAIHIEYHPSQGADPWSGSLQYRNIPWGYQLDIQSARVTP